MEKNIDKHDLEEFVGKIDGFTSLPHSEKTLCFGYYLQSNLDIDFFCGLDILKCYAVLDIPPPANIADIIAKARDKEKIVAKNGGSRLSKEEYDRINRIVEAPILSDTKFEKVYEAGHIFDFYKDVKTLVSSAKSSVFVIDAYANEDVIELYLERLVTGVKIMILTNDYQGNFLNIAKKFKLKHNANFVVRTNAKCHDRLLFIDKSCYVIGQSIDKAANDKPTYLVRILNGGAFRKSFQMLFDAGKTIV